MTVEVFTYPFIFIALFFEVFLLVTFLSKPARQARSRGISSYTPHVSLIIPCFNEEATVTSTAESALALDYPKDKLEIILINDGSTDGTREAMDRFANHPQVRIIHKENGGKHTALNMGIDTTSAEIVGCLDADSFLDPQALRRTLVCFDKQNVVAAFSAIAINKPKGPVERLQSADYLLGIFFRHALCSINAFFVTPGPFSLYRRNILLSIGGFRFGQQTEDMELALRLQKAGYEIDNVPRALVTTNAQKTISGLVKQRARWTSGFIRNVLFDYRDMMSSRFGTLGLLVLPIGLITPVSTIILFFLSIYLLVKAIVEAVLIRQGIPFTWYLPSFSSFGSFEWFYIPVNFVTLQAVVTVVLTVLLAYVGKKISDAPNNVTHDVFYYIFLYSFIAPFWFMRATVDVIMGKRRGWR